MVLMIRRNEMKTVAVKNIKRADGKIAGELCKENSEAVWIYDNVGVK